MEKTATLNLRVNSTVKQRAEEVLTRLGIPMSTAIDIYLNQIFDGWTDWRYELLKCGICFCEEKSAKKLEKVLDTLLEESQEDYFSEYTKKLEKVNAEETWHYHSSDLKIGITCYMTYIRWQTTLKSKLHRRKSCC